LAISLGLIGIGYAAWNDNLSIGFAVDTASFEPQIEVTGVNRTWQLGLIKFSKDFPLNVLPDENGQIIIKVGECKNDHIKENAVPGDQYRIYFNVTNNSDIPIMYRATNLLKGLEAFSVTVKPSDWVRLEPSQTSENNYVDIHVSHLYYSPLEVFIGGCFSRDFAAVEFKQFNGTGWIANVDLGIDIQEFVLLRLSDPSADYLQQKEISSPAKAQQLSDDDNQVQGPEDLTPGEAGQEPGEQNPQGPAVHNPGETLGPSVNGQSPAGNPSQDNPSSGNGGIQAGDAQPAGEETEPNSPEQTPPPEHIPEEPSAEE